MILKRGDMVSDCGHIDSDARPDQETRVFKVTGNVVWYEPGSTHVRLPCDWVVACVPCASRAGGLVRNLENVTRPAPHEGADVDLGEPS